MNLVIFFIILGVLIISHELGHFLSAKFFGIRADEFGIGFPPRIWAKKYGNTEYSINWIPFGGFVRIYGEDGDLSGKEKPFPDSSNNLGVSIQRKPRWVQAIVIAAGVIANLIVAWVICSILVIVGIPASTSFINKDSMQDVGLAIVATEKGGAANLAGIPANSRVLSVSTSDKSLDNPTDTAFQEFILRNGFEDLNISHRIVGESSVVQTKVTPIIDPATGRPRIGVGLDEIGLFKSTFYESPISGFVLVLKLTQKTILDYKDLFAQIFKGNGGDALAVVSGPIGIAGLVKDAAAMGPTSLLLFTAIISISLAIINLIPFPALDGGRLFFLLIEAIIKRPLPVKFTQIANTIGFFALIALLIIVSFNDILKILR